MRTRTGKIFIVSFISPLLSIVSDELQSYYSTFGGGKIFKRVAQKFANKLGSKGLFLIFHLLLELGFDAFLTHYRENLSALPKKKTKFRKTH